MVADGTYTGVVDRIEENAQGDELAVVILECDGESVDQLVVPVTELPDEGQSVDSVLEVEVADDELVAACYDAEETRRRAESAQSMFDRLARRPPEETEDTDRDAS